MYIHCIVGLPINPVLQYPVFQEKLSHRHKTRLLFVQTENCGQQEMNGASERSLMLSYIPSIQSPPTPPHLHPTSTPRLCKAWHWHAYFKILTQGGDNRFKSLIFCVSLYVPIFPSSVFSSTKQGDCQKTCCRRRFRSNRVKHPRPRLPSCSSSV